MSLYEELVTKSQWNFMRYQPLYRRGETAYMLTECPEASYEASIAQMVTWLQEAETIIVGGASGLSAAGGGDFYYGGTPSFYEHFGRFAKKYGFKGAFSGMQYGYRSREAFWAYLATFLYTTQTAAVRQPYKDLDLMLKGKDFYVITTNQDTQFVKMYPQHKVSELQGDHRFFQCARCCTDDIWDAVKPVAAMVAAIDEDTLEIPSDLVPRCPHCGGEAFPWVRGYGNFLQGYQYDEEYERASQYLADHCEDKLLFLELGVGRMTPMFIQEPFWQLVAALPNAKYIGVNDRYAFLPKTIEDKGMVITADISQVLRDGAQRMMANRAESVASESALMADTVTSMTVGSERPLDGSTKA